TMEFLRTLPVSTGQAVIGKFGAAWIFAGIALALTFPIWITVNYLGQPDNGVIVAAYLGSWLMAGGFLALSSCVSALTKNQVIAFVLAAAICFIFLMSGVEIVQAFFRAWAPQAFVDSIAELSFLTNFNDLSQGVIDIRDLIFFGMVIGVALYINTLVVETRKGA
ncbi:MAG: ABC transporter permease, partial [Alphaproteobacteria bacterium]